MKIYFKFMLSISLLTGLFLIPATHAAARVMHVPNEYETIPQALSVSQSGDTIKLAAGTYAEAIELMPGVTLSGNDPKTTVITGSPYALKSIITLFDKSVLEGVTIKGATTGVKGAVYVAAGSPRISNCIITENQVPAIFVEQNTSPTIEHNKIFKNARSAIEVTYAAPNISANQMYDNRGFGILVSGALEIIESSVTGSSTPGNTKEKQATIIGNTIENNKGGAIMCQGSSPLIVENTIGNQRGRSIILVKSDAVIKKNEITSGGPPAIYIESGNPIIEENNINGVMRFPIWGKVNTEALKTIL